MATQRKGDLEVTLSEARNLGVRKSSNLYCTLNMSNKSHQSSISKGSQWNQTFTLDLLSLDNEELSIELFKQRRIKKDKFLGQIQIPIKALKLPKEATWYYLCDRPDVSMDEPPSWILLINPEASSNMKKSSSNGNNSSGSSLNLSRRDKKSYIISGEILIKLQFVHRLLRARSQNAIKKAASMYSTIGHSLDLGEFNKPNKRLSRATSTILEESFESSSSSAPNSPSPSLSLSRDDEDLSSNGPLEKPNNKEAIIIEEALKEKQKIAREKLEQQKEMIKFMSLRLMDKERSEGASNVREEKLKLEEIQQNILEMEDALKLSSEKAPRERVLEKRVSALHLLDVKKASPKLQASSSRATKVSYSDLPRLDVSEVDILNQSLTHLEDYISPSSSFASSSPPSSTSTSNSPIIRTAQAHVQAAQIQAQAQAAELEGLNARIRKLEDELDHQKRLNDAIEGDLEHEKKMNEVLKTNNNLLEREVKRLEADIDRERWERERFEREEQWKERLLEIERLFLKQQLVKAHNPVDDVVEEKIDSVVEEANGKDTPVDERETQLNNRVELAQSLLKEVDDKIKSTTLLKQQLHTEMVENKLKKRQQMLKKIQEQHKSLESRLSLLHDEKEETDTNASDIEDEAEPEMEDDEPLSPRSKNIHRRRKSEAQLDMLVVKLEKLDKLDELLRKIDTIKVASGPSVGGSSGESTIVNDGKHYTDMKTELEQLQAIIFDDTGKHTEKEKMDANIKYEKTFQIYQRTDEYRKDMAALLDERRKRNEPLNKEALARVIDRYSSDNLKSNPDLKQKLVKAPELNLIFMDPKAILAKHQNDFMQYQLNKLDLDELRAVRACLPKFRNDQTKQNDWVDSLEQKIEIYAVNPPIKKPATQQPSKFKKPKATKQSSPGDFLVELLQRFKNKPEEKEEDKKGSRRNTVSFRSPLRLSSFSKRDSHD